MIPAVSEWARREQHGGNPGQRPADHRQEVHQRHPQRPQVRERHACDQERDEHHHAGDHRGEDVAEHVPGDRAVDLVRDPPVPLRPVRGHRAQQGRPHLRAFQQQEQDQHEDGEQFEQQGQRALAQAQGGLGQPFPETHQLGRVLIHPRLHVILGHEMADPAPSVGRRGHVARQLQGQVVDPVGQRGAEREGEAGEDDQGPQGHHRDRPAPPLDLPPLQGHHGRVQDHGDEAATMISSSTSRSR